MRIYIALHFLFSFIFLISKRWPRNGKEFDTYKVGTVANSCSTMHKIQKKEFTREDFSCEHLSSEMVGINAVSYMNGDSHISPEILLNATIGMLNYYRKCFIEDGKSKDDWWQIIQLLPSSYNQTRNVMLNYEILANIYKSHKDHKLDEWREFCKWIETFPYSEFICGSDSDDETGDGNAVSEMENFNARR